MTAGSAGDRHVADYYDKWTELFLEEFGPVFQAGALRVGAEVDHHTSVLEMARRAGVRNGDRILDAGCGVGGPAAIIAGALPDVLIDGVTISGRQVELGRQRLADLGLAERVRLHAADYHATAFEDGTFDIVLFLESTGYTYDADQLCAEAFRLLRPGGRLYMKDVFRRSGELTEVELTQMRAFDDLWGCVESLTIEGTVASLERAGFVGVEGRELDGVDTVELKRRMWTLDLDEGVVLSKLGQKFYRPDIDPPTVFGEAKAFKPA